MGGYSDINQGIKSIVKQVIPQLMTLINAEVVSIENNNTITVTFDGQIYTDIRLTATVNSEANTLVIIPKVGSMVLLQSVSGDYTDLVLLKVNEAQSISYTQGDLKVVIDGESQKVRIENGAVNLKDLFETTADFIGNLIVITPMGACEVLAPLPSDLQAFKVDVNKLLY